MGDDFERGASSSTPNPDNNERIRAAENILVVAKEAARLQGEVAEYKKSTPTFRELNEELTGARRSIEATVAAARESVETSLRRELGDLKAEVDKNKPPGLWKIVAIAAGAVLTFGTIVWNASSRVGDLALQNALLQRDVGALREAISRQDTEHRQLAARVEAACRTPSSP